MAKFKEGSVVKVIRDTVVILRGAIGVVIDYHGKDMVNVDFGKDIGVKRLPESVLEFTTPPVLYGLREFVEKQVDVETSPPIVSPVKDAFTDPNVDYEALSEEPVYYEFIDIGKALNKLKKYEHLGCKPSDSKEEVMYAIEDNQIVPILVKQKEYVGRTLNKAVLLDYGGNTFTVGTLSGYYKTFTEALRNLKDKDLF